MTAFEIAVYVGWDTGGIGKGESGRSENLAIIFIVAAVFVFLPLIITAVIIVSIVWTHRPDLSVIDIGREILKEIKNTKAGKNRREGKRI